MILLIRITKDNIHTEINLIYETYKKAKKEYPNYLLTYKNLKK